MADLTAPDGELLPEAIEKLAALDGDLESKLEACCRVLRNFESEADVCKSEADRLARRAQLAANNARRLKEYMQRTLELLGVPKIRAGTFRLSVCSNGGRLSVDTSGALIGAISPEFQRVTTTLDTDRIREALEAGREVPGCRLLPRGSHLRIS